MKYVILEDGRIINSSTIITCNNYVPEFENGTFVKIKIIDRADNLDLAKQRLIEYCADKEKVLIALWVKNLKKRVCIKLSQPEIILNEKITKNHLIAQLVNLNHFALYGNPYNEKELLALIKRIKVIDEGEQR